MYYIIVCVLLKVSIIERYEWIPTSQIYLKNNLNILKMLLNIVN